MTHPSLRDRAYGALLGLAIGDALGMPTQLMPRAAIVARYGVLDGFEPGPTENPISAGMAAGRVTDDTDQAVILGRLLVEGGGRIDPQLFARALVAWEARMIAAGSADLLGPSTKAALQRVVAGTPPEQAGRGGATNGAAMRVAPVGIAVPPLPLPALVDAVEQASFLTHNTGTAIAGAAAVAAAISAGVDGADMRAALASAVPAARLGAERGHYHAGADLAARIEWALDLVSGCDAETALDRIYRLIGTGTGTQEAVPAALAICAASPDDPWRACLLAASLGGDCDTVAAMAGAIAGAVHGASAFPAAAVARLEAANPDLGLSALAEALLGLRRRAGKPTHRGRPTRLLSVGSILADLSVSAPHLPARGGDVIASGARLAAGGGFNVLAAAARQGLPAMFAGRHGTGPFGDCVRAALAHDGIAALLAPTPDADTGFCVVIVEPDGERSFITSPGVEADPGPSGLASVILQSGDAVFCSGYDLTYPRLGPAIAGWLQAVPSGIMVAVDPGPLAAEIPAAVRQSVFARCDILTMNRCEARLLTGAVRTEEVARRLRAACRDGTLLIVRDGARGCDATELAGEPVVAHVSAPAVHAVDTTGAGDAHTGVLIASLAAGADWITAVRRANVAAAYSVTRRGPATAPSASELDDMLAGADFS